MKEKYALDATGATFRSSKKSVASVSKKGVITGKKKGIAKIAVSLEGAEIAVCEVTVLAAPGKVTLSAKKASMKAGGTLELAAKLPKKTASRITWTSSAPGVATVDEGGVVTAVRAGKAKIKAKTFNGKSASCTVTVKAVAPTKVAFEVKSISIGVKEAVTAVPIINEGAEATYTWSTKDKTIATVNKKGKITGKKAGSTKITVATQNGKKATLKVKVLKAPGKVTLSASTATLAAGETLELKATLPKKTASHVLSWTSSDSAVAAVDGDGRVTGIAPGTAEIAVATFNGKKAACRVTVEAAPEPTEGATPDPTEEPTVKPTPEPPAAEPVCNVDDYKVNNSGEVYKYTGSDADIVIPSEDKDGNPIVAIQSRAFAYNTVLRSIVIPGSVASVREDAFLFCTGLKRVVMLNGVSSIGGSLFYGTSLESVSLPNTIASMDPFAFVGCSKLTEIKLEDGSRDYTLYDGILFNASRTKLVMCPGSRKGEYVIPDGVTEIGEAAFHGCAGLSGIVIPDTVKTIGHAAFLGCAGLTCASIPNSVVEIEHEAFECCAGLKSVRLPDGLTTLSRYLFSDCEALTDIVIPDSVTKIEQSAFKGCASLRDIDIQNSVTEIGDLVFNGCTGLEEIHLPEGMDKTPSGLFWGCSSLNHLPISASVKSIGEYTFCKCTGLTDIAIPIGVAELEHYAFKDCASLTRVAIPNSVKSISKAAFSNCPNVTFAVAPDSYAEKWCKTYSMPYTTDASLITGKTYAFADVKAAFQALAEDHIPLAKLNGVGEDESLPEWQWVLNGCFDILHVNLSVFKSAKDKQAYLFESAFKAAAGGQEVVLADTARLPDGVKQLSKAIDAGEDAYLRELVRLSNANGNVMKDVYLNNFKSIYENYGKGALDDAQLADSLAAYQVPADQLAAVASNFTFFSALQQGNAVIGKVGKAAKYVNGYLDIYNQVNVLRALDRDALASIAVTYRSSGDGQMRAVGDLLMEIHDAGSLEDMALLVISEKLADMGLDALLDSVSLTNGLPVYKLAFSAVDSLFGTGDYSRVYNEIMWSAEAVREAHDTLELALKYYQANRSDANLSDCCAAYTNYLGLAAASEEAYVAVVDYQKKTPIIQTPEYILAIRDATEERAAALRALAEKVAAAKALWNEERYTEAKLALDGCIEDQRAINAIVARTTGSGA